MNLEDVKVGMKVVPHSKLKQQLNSEVWNNCIRKNQPYMYVVRLDRKDSYTIVVCGDKNDSLSGDCFIASDLTHYEERYTCNIPGVTIELIPGKEYQVSDYSMDDAMESSIKTKYICSINGEHVFETLVGGWVTWRYAIDTDKELETEMTVEEIAEALRKSGTIKGKLKIKE